MGLFFVTEVFLLLQTSMPIALVTYITVKSIEKVISYNTGLGSTAPRSIPRKSDNKEQQQ